MLKNIKKTFLLVVSLICLLLISGCSWFSSSEGTKDPSTFDAFSEGLLSTLLGEDELSSNYLFTNPEDFGLTHYEPSLPTPSVMSALSLVATNLYFGQIKQYNYDLLDDDQKMTYNIIVELLDYINGKTSEMSYLSNNYLGTYLGYQAQLPLILVEYHFNSKLDIENYFKFLDLIPDTFNTYYEFEVEKADKGYGMADYVIDNVVTQCNNFVSSIDSGESFMLDVVNKKLESCTFLTIDEIALYKQINEEKVTGPLREGYVSVSEQLPSLKGKATNELGLAHYVTSSGVEIGKKYYENEFKHVVGYDITCDEAIEYIDNKIDKYLAELTRLRVVINEDTNLKNTLNGILNDEIRLYDDTPENTIIFLKKKAESYFPTLSATPVITVKYIDSSMQDNFSPAAYMTSAIDNYTSESIYLNPADIYLTDDYGNLTSTLDYNYLYTTLAHEGLAGHLYQNVYFKNKDVNVIRKVLKNSGYTEGWATYVEYFSYNYLSDTFDQTIIDYLKTSSLLNAAIYSRIDLGIHYNGWTQEETYEFMRLYFNVTSVDQITKAYRQLVEIPTNYQEYFFTYLKFQDMYDRVSTALGDDFDVIEFHQTILDCGSVALKYVEEVINNKYFSDNN